MNTPDFWNMIAVERGMPEGWRWWSIQTLGDPRAPREHAAALCPEARALDALIADYHRRAREALLRIRMVSEAEMVVDETGEAGA